MEPCSSIYFENRLGRLAAELKKTDADGLLVFSAEYDNRPSVQYFSGFTGSFAVLVLGRGGGRLVTDSRYFLQAEEESFFPLVKMEDRDPWPAVARAIGELGIEKLAAEDDKLTLERAGCLKKIVPSVKNTAGLVRRLRAVKDEWELEALRRSASVAAEAFEAFLPAIRPGRTEAEIAADLVHEMMKRGAQQPAKGHFVVASGPRGARPHGVFTNRVLERGDFITLDFGAVVDGYFSDITRTAALGEPDPKLAEIYHIVEEARKRAVAAVSSRVSGGDVDRTAREYITSKGWGDCFTHSTGHGIGLELHELPVVSRLNNEKLPAGAVVTIEPGIYVEGLGGVRIEDDVIVTEEGCEVITKASPTELRVLSPA
ncbi:MAG: M24 family metallopeptidase [Aminivibrio sp.]|jgi:Xaa-Pro aminopeptidase|nr:aminopeptidase P family protein [Synergistaceae bacterium]